MMNYKYSAGAEHCVCTIETSTACEILASYAIFLLIG